MKRSHRTQILTCIVRPIKRTTKVHKLLSGKLKHPPARDLNLPPVFPPRTGGPAVGGRSPSTGTTRTSPTSATVRQNTLSLFHFFALSVFACPKREECQCLLKARRRGGAPQILQGFLLFLRDPFSTRLHRHRLRPETHTHKSSGDAILFCSMKKEFTINPHLTSMPVTYSGRSAPCGQR